MITGQIKSLNRVLKNILCLYPLYTVLLILYPWVVALFVVLFLAENAIHGRFIRKGSPLVLKVG